MTTYFFFKKNYSLLPREIAHRHIEIGEGQPYGQCLWVLKHKISKHKVLKHWGGNDFWSRHYIGEIGYCVNCKSIIPSVTDEKGNLKDKNL